jgi:hypothetical protein
MSWLTDLEAKLGINIPPPPAPWMPTYQLQAYVTSTLGDGSTESVPVSVTYLVTMDTAQHLQQIYDPSGSIVSIPFVPPAGGVSGPMVIWLQWPNGVKIIAGMLASYFTNNPNNPDVADKMVRVAIQAAGAA